MNSGINCVVDTPILQELYNKVKNKVESYEEFKTLVSLWWKREKQKNPQFDYEVYPSPEEIDSLLAERTNKKEEEMGSTISYTPKGKRTQVYTIKGSHIYNRDGKEVFAKDSIDRNKIFANLAVKSGRAVVVEHKNSRYVVNNRNQIISVATGKIMQWDEKNGDRNAIIKAAQEKFNGSHNTIKESEYSKQLIEILQMLITRIKSANIKEAKAAQNLYEWTIEAQQAILDAIEKGERKDEDLPLDRIQKNLNDLAQKTPEELAKDFIEALKEMSKDWGRSIAYSESIQKPTSFNWGRTSDNNYEVSSAGDSRFSAFNAKLKPGTKILGVTVPEEKSTFIAEKPTTTNSIEYVYQTLIKKSGKGQAPSKDSKLYRTTVSSYSGDITPDANTIFVFGSNPEGRHGAGAAKVAREKFGAIYGQGEGLQGNAYALPTKDLRVTENRGLRSISESQIIENIKKLYETARQNPDKQFKVAYRNTDRASLNGYTGLEMIDMFLKAGSIPTNIVFSKEWVDTGRFNLSRKEKEDFSYAKGYLPLWQEWAKQNPELIEELRTKAAGKTLTDQFAYTRVSQARALADILNSTSSVSKTTEEAPNISEYINIEGANKGFLTKKGEELLGTTFNKDEFNPGTVSVKLYPGVKGTTIEIGFISPKTGHKFYALYNGNPTRKVWDLLNSEQQNVTNVNDEKYWKAIDTIVPKSLRDLVESGKYNELDSTARETDDKTFVVTETELENYFEEKYNVFKQGRSTEYNTNQINKALNTKSETVEEAPIFEDNETSIQDSYSLASGDAVGSDAAWTSAAREAGIKNTRNFSTKSYDALSEDEKKEADSEYLKAATELNRPALSNTTYKGKLVRRNWLQVKNADAIFAIGSIVNSLERGRSGLNYSKHAVVDGGTGYAVQMAINNNKPVHVFDQDKGKWFTWKDGNFVEEPSPVLTKRFAGIGTRQINDSGKAAIKEIFSRTFNLQQENGAIVNNFIPFSEEIEELSLEERGLTPAINPNDLEAKADVAFGTPQRRRDRVNLIANAIRQNFSIEFERQKRALQERISSETDADKIVELQEQLDTLDEKRSVELGLNNILVRIKKMFQPKDSLPAYYNSEFAKLQDNWDTVVAEALELLKETDGLAVDFIETNFDDETQIDEESGD